MKAFSSIVLASIVVSVLIFALPVLASVEPSVGVKEGDWIEYSISMTGIGSLPPTHDVTWLRIEVLPVEDTAFSANFTVRYSNGSVGSAIWEFNLTKGELGGWIIIPSNLSPGDTFYDLSRHNEKPVYVTVQSQEQKTVLGATRTIIYGSDSFRHKEWDKKTGVFIGSSEHFKNVTNKNGWYMEDVTVTTQAIATNMWKADTTLEADKTSLYTVTAVIVIAVLAFALALYFARKNKLEKSAFSLLSQGKIAVLTIVIVVLVEIATILYFPFYDIGMSFAEFNLIMQTLWTVLVLVSMWFRKRENYFVHEITMLIVMSAWAVGFIAVLFMDPLSGSTEIFSSTALRLIMNALHGIFSIPALVFGLWLVALWRPYSTTFASKSRRVAKLTTFFWVPSYVVGVLDFMVLHTTFFG